MPRPAAYPPIPPHALPPASEVLVPGRGEFFVRDTAAGDAGSVSGDLKSTLASVDRTAGSAATAIGDMRSSLSDAADGLDRTAKRISDLHSSLSSALDADAAPR